MSVAAPPIRRIAPSLPNAASAGMLYLHLPAPNAGHHVQIVYAADSAAGATQTRNAAVGTRFRDLAEWWHSDTDASSFDRDRYEHPAYKRIIEELGEDAIPFILDDLRDKSGHWFDALRHLSGDQTVDVRCDGNMRQARALWLQWGARRKLI